MSKFYTYLLLVLLPFGQTWAQTFSISGTVKDSKGVLAGASIYLADTQIATASNAHGTFALKNLAPGNYQVLVQMMGYMPYKTAVSIQNKSVNISVLLSTNVTQLNEVVIGADKNRAFYLALFRQNFIGTSNNAKNCKIINPEVLITHYNTSNKQLTVHSNDFLIIENKALGYRLKYLLSLFEMDNAHKITYYQGYPYFEEMKGSPAKIKKWNQARKKTYLGSKMHFYRTLATHTNTAEGFNLHQLIEKPNPNRLPDELINTQIKKILANSEASHILTFTPTDSLAFYLTERSKPSSIFLLNRAFLNPDSLTHFFNAHLNALKFDHQLYVIYTKDKPEKNFALSGYQESTPVDLKNQQISTIKIINAPLLFFKNGEIENPRSAVYGGYWAYKRIADYLPLDYQPNP